MPEMPVSQGAVPVPAPVVPVPHAIGNNGGFVAERRTIKEIAMGNSTRTAIPDARPAGGKLRPVAAQESRLLPPR
jgi:hypothetical protein